MYKIAILSIGDEIVIGQTVNTNASWMSQSLLVTGANITTVSCIRDDRQTIISEIERLSKNNDLILITGGLGPTHDDITKKVIAEYFDDELVLDQAILNKLKEWFVKRGRTFYKRHETQATIPSKSIIFPNEVGTAQGMLFEGEGFALVSMPGVPTEMKFIMQNSVIPYVKDQISNNNFEVEAYRTIKTAGIGESDLAELIGDLDFLNNSTLAYLPSYRGVKLRVGTQAKSLDLAEKELDRLEEYLINKIGSFVTTIGDQDLTELIGKLLKERKETLSVAESCTGGGLGSAITDIAGSSAYFEGGIISYSNEVKVNQLGVSEHTLKKYGAVSQQTAIEMASGVRKKLNTDYGISITGVAGPGGGTEEKPVGTVWIGLSDKKNTIAKKYVFSRSRSQNREISVGFALTLLFNRIKEQ